MRQPNNRFKETIDFYYKHYHQLVDFYTIAKYCFYPDTRDERLVAGSDPFFVFVAGASWGLVVMDLCKIFATSKMQKHNIIKFLNSLKTRPEYSSMLEKVGSPFVNESLAAITARQTAINQLVYLRDKYYAHTDDLTIDPNQLINPSFAEIEALLGILRSIISTLSEKVLDSQCEFRDETDSDNINPRAVLRDLVKVRIR